MSALMGLGDRLDQRPSETDRALLACSSRPSLSGAELQVIVGHMTVRALLRRGLMGIMRHVYVFIENSYDRRQRLWPSVVRELELFRNLMPLATGNMRSGWASDIFTTDACPTGYAVCRSKACCSLVARIGREDERWRYYRGGPERRAPRSAALDTSLVFEDPLTVKPDYVNECELLENPEFREVPTHILEPEQWHQLWNSRFNGKEPIHVLECRSVL